MLPEDHRQRPPGRETDTSPWHAGEIALQTAYGAAERMARLGPVVIRDQMPEQHRSFFAGLPFLVLGAVDEDGAPWATLVTGAPGFAHAPDGATLRIDARVAPDDPAAAGVRCGAALGLLGIEPASRQRNRVNGRIAACDAGGLTLAVEQSFGNCPQYIVARSVEVAARAPQPTENLDGLDAGARALIAAADTFFVASYAETERGRQVDVSHRGGRPGFVHVDADGALTIPDFSGNRFFNTLGNVLASGCAGLAFLAPEGGETLQISGEAELLPGDAADLADADRRFAGAERFWRVRPRRIVRRRGGGGLRFGAGEASAAALETGAWA